MECPKAALFDLDETLAESFKAPKPEMIERLARVRERMPLALISGANFERLKEEVLDALMAADPKKALYAFPDSASVGYELENGSWKQTYSVEFQPEELELIKRTLEECATQSGILLNSAYEPKILLEKTQARFAALGLNATEADKDSWDPQKTKRQALKALLDERLPDCEVLIGGRTTIDITRKGIDKAHGVRWLSERLKVPPQEMFYVGDALYEGGNDFVVIQTGIITRRTSGPDETLGIIDELLAACAA